MSVGRRFGLSVSSLLVAMIPCLANAGGVGISFPYPTAVQYSTGTRDSVYMFRVGVGTPGQYRYRDVELFWDTLFVVARNEVGASLAIKNTLDRIGANVCDSPGDNPYGAPEMSDVELVYDYLYPVPGASYDYDPFAPQGFLVAAPGTGTSLKSDPDANPISTDIDNAHVDVYIYPSYNGARRDEGIGMYESGFWTVKEDSSSGHWFELAGGDSFVVFHANSIMSPGPVIGAIPLVDTSGAGWAGHNATVSLDIGHEFQHSFLISGAQLPYDEIFSSAAEALASFSDSNATFECPSAWSVFHTRVIYDSEGKPHTQWDNYQAWRALAGYLIYNFPGADTSRTLGGFADDLMYRWAKGTRTFKALSDLLADSTCSDCARLYGYEPRNEVRFSLLLHDWRVACYVDNPDLAQGQYGFAPQGQFHPAYSERAWHAFNADSCDDYAVLPAEVTLTRGQEWESQRFFKTRDVHPSRCPTPVSIDELGAQYWVVRSDTSLSYGSQDLVVRVAADSVLNIIHRDGRLLATVVPYVEQALASGQPDSLWRHPEWARAPLPTQWVDVDSIASALEFRVPGFGTTTKAALVVLSLCSGQGQQLLVNGQGSVYTIPYRLSLAIRDAAMDTLDNRLVLRSAGTNDDHPAWSPAGNELLVEATVPEISTRPQIYRVPLWQGGVTRLVAQDADQHEPDWSPRGDWVAFEAESTLGV